LVRRGADRERDPARREGGGGDPLWREGIELYRSHGHGS